MAGTNNRNPETMAKKGWKIAANFAVQDETVDESIAQSQLQQLKLEAEELFSFRRYQETEPVLRKILQLEAKLYSQDSKQVQDTKFELEGLTRAIHEASITKPKRKGLIKLNLSSSKGHEPGLECAKMLMANALLKTELGCLFYNERHALKLYRQAFEDRLEEFGPESLLMLLAQRLYYTEAAAHLGVKDCICPKAKEELARKLKCILGADHLLCNDLESALQLKDATLSVQLDNAMSKVLLHEPKLQRDAVNLDQRRIAIARSIAAEAIPRGPVAVANAEFQLAQVLMKAFEFDEALRLLMNVFKARVELFGYQCLDSVSTLDAICNFDVSRDFVSFRLLKQLNEFLLDIGTGIVRNLFMHPAMIKASFFSAFIAGKVLECDEDSILLMQDTRRKYARLYGLSDKFLFYTPKIKGKLVMNNGTPLYFYDQFDETSDRQDFLAASRKVYFDPSLEVKTWRQNMEILTKLYYKASKYLKPHDPIRVHILEMYGDCIYKQHSIRAKIQPNDIKFLKTETKKLGNLLGDNHPLVIKALVTCGLAESKCDGALSTKIISVYEVCLRMSQDVFGPQHEITALAHEALGHILAKFRKYHPKAKKLLRESTEILKKVFEPLNHHTILAEHHGRVGVTFEDIGDSTGAAEYVQFCLQTFNKQKKSLIHLVPEDVFAISH